MQIWIHDSKMKKIVALNNDIPEMLHYSNSTWHPYLEQATSTFDFTIPKFVNGKLHEDIKLINDECFVSFYVNGSHQVFYIATLQEDDFNIQLTCNNTNLEYALEYANPFSSNGAQTIEWYLNHMDLLSFAAVEIGINEISDRKRTLTFDSQETKMARLQSLMSNFDAEFEFKTELNRDGTYKRIVINIYQKSDETHHGIGSVRGDVVLYYDNGLKGVQVNSDKTQMFNAGVFTGKDGLSLNDVEISEKNADGIEEFYSRKGNPCLYAPLAMNRYRATMRAEGQDNWIRKDFSTEYENINDLKAYALRTLKQYAYPLMTYTASVQSKFIGNYSDLALGDTVKIIDNNFAGGLALEARVSEMIISFDNPNNNSIVFTNYRKIDNKPSSALQTRIEQAVESKLPYRIELATTGGVTFKNNEGETIVKPSLYKGNLPCTTDVTWRWALDSVVTVGTQYRIQAKDITDTAVLTVAAYVGNLEVATTEITLTNVNDGKKSNYYSDTFPEDTPKGTLEKGDSLFLTVGDTVKQYYWNGTEWAINPVVSDVEAFKEQIAEELKDVPNREEFENKISEELANSKAEIETQIETAKTQAESNAKEYADTINQETAKVAEQANTAADEIKADLVNVKNNLTATSLIANNAQASVDEAKQDLTEVANELNTAKQDLADSVTAVNTKVDSTKAELTQAKQDLTSHAQQLQTQANAQTELTKRVTTVETTANGTKTTVSELSKTVDQNGKDITSVTARTKTVEDDLLNTKTTLSQVKTTADSTSQKTATLETGLNGLTAKFENLKIGSRNYFKDSKSRKYYIDSTGTQDVRTFIDDDFWKNDTRFTKDYVRMSFDIAFNPALPTDFATNVHFSASPWYNCGGITFKGGTTALQHFDLKFNLSGAGNSYKTDNVFIRLNNTIPLNTAVSLENFKLYLSAVVEDYSRNESDIESKVAEYKQTADQNYASLQSTVQALDGTVTANKATADQTAQGFSTRIESLETYKDGESTRANQYFESAKTETARQLTAERTAIAKDYVAKSTYTSDVTGIRNDLSATTTTANTTKTNLANYQASNDKAVANLQSNLQTANGNISSLQTKIEAVPGQITSAVSAVEGKIPTSIGGRNLYALSQNNSIAATNISEFNQNISTGEISFKVTGPDPYFGSISNKGEAFSSFRGVKIPVKTGQGFAVYLTNKLFVKNFVSYFGEDDIAVKNFKNYQTNKFVIPASELDGVSYVTFRFGIKENTQPVGSVHKTKVKVEYGNVYTDWSPAPEDAASQISSLSSQIQQTANGMTLLATKTELNTAKSDLQSGITTATNKANTAQSTADSAVTKANTAQSTADNNAQTISTHTTQISALNTGLSAKVSQTDFNTLSGRVTTAENNITATANEFSSKITSVEGKIPSGEMNLVQYGRPYDGYSPYNGAEYATHSFYYNSAYKMYIIKNTATSEKTFGMNRFKVERNTDYTLYFKGFNNSAITNMDVWFLKRVNGSTKDFDSAQILVSGRELSASKAEDVSVTFNTGNYDEGYIRFDNNGSTTAGTQADLYFGDVSVKKGKSNDGWSPSLAELASSQDLKAAKSEIKQTTDSISASVSALDNSTVKSASLTINTDGIVMKAGKSTTDVANAIGSYFAVNQNAINLFSDNINVKGSMIVDGAITSDKIASKQINTAHLNGKIITADVISSNAVTADAIKAGAVTTDKMSADSINGDRITAGTLDAAKIKAGSITASQIASGTITSAQIKTGTISSANIAAGAITGDNIKANSVDVTKIVGIDADYIKAKIEYAMIDWLKGKTITAYNDNMTIDLQNGRISFKDGSNAVYRQTPDGIHTGFLHFEADSQGGIYAAFGATSTRQGINSKSSEFAGIRCYRVSADGDSHDAKIDKIEVIGDTVQFGHSYRSDGSIGGGFIMDTAAFGNETPYSLNRVIKSIEALWRILHDHAKNTGYRFDDSLFIGALNNEYNTWHDMHNM